MTDNLWKTIKAGHIPAIDITDDTKRVLYQILKSKSKNENGDAIDIEDLEECLEALGFSPDDEDVNFLKKHLDENMDGELEIGELLRNLDVVNYHCYYGKELMREFKRIDKDDDGVIRYPEMLKVLMTEGPNPLETFEARQLLDRLAREFDTNFDGKFSYPEFVKIYMSDLLPYKDTLSVESPQEKGDMAGAGSHLTPEPCKLSKRKTSTSSVRPKTKSSSAARRGSKSPRKKSDKGSAGSDRPSCSRT